MHCVSSLGSLQVLSPTMLVNGCIDGDIHVYMYEIYE